MTKDEALKLALEALENSRSLEPVDVQWVKGKRHAAITAIREALAEQPAQQQYTYASTQATMCAGCGEHKHTPLRIDAMGGYVCLTCIDKELGSLLGEFGYPQPAQQPNEADELIRSLGFDPEQFRTEAGFINHMKLRAAIRHPDEYHAAMQPMYQKLTNCVLCGRLNPKEGVCNHGVEQPAQQHIEHCLWARNGNKPCPHVQPAQQGVDWEKMYRLEVKKKEALAAKYERDTGKKLTRIVPMAEQPAQQQEPVAWRTKNAAPPGGYVVFQQYPQAVANLGGEIEPLYTSPPASKPWAGLTEEEIQPLLSQNRFAVFALARAIEAKLREKNA